MALIPWVRQRLHIEASKTVARTNSTSSADDDVDADAAPFVQQRRRIAYRNSEIPHAFEASNRAPAAFTRDDAAADRGETDFPDRPPRLDSTPPFPSLGPEGHRQRMREKLLSRTAGALEDYELLEMLLFFAFKQGDTKPLAKSLINRFGSVADVLTMPTDTLLRARGLGQHAVAAIRLVEALAQRLARAELLDVPVLSNMDALIAYLTIIMAREPVEQFRVLFLDPRNRLIADEAQGRGTVNHTPVYPREVVKRALELHATALILVHNHPSGDPTPSRDDVEMTLAVRSALDPVGITLHDHIVIGRGRWISLKREGFLDA